MKRLIALALAAMLAAPVFAQLPANSADELQASNGGGKSGGNSNGSGRGGRRP